MAEHQERRREPRLQRSERLILKVLSVPGQDESLTGTTMSSATYDVSARGLRVRVEQALPAGTAIDLWIKVHDQPGTFYFTGAVRWCRQEEQGAGYMAGIEITEQPTDDTNAWSRLVTGQLHDQDKA